MLYLPVTMHDVLCTVHANVRPCAVRHFRFWPYLEARILCTHNTFQLGVCALHKRPDRIKKERRIASEL